MSITLIDGFLGLDVALSASLALINGRLGLDGAAFLYVDLAAAGCRPRRRWTSTLQAAWTVVYLSSVARSTVLTALELAVVVKAVVLGRLLPADDMIGAMQGCITGNDEHVKEVAAQTPKTNQFFVICNKSYNE